MSASNLSLDKIKAIFLANTSNSDLLSLPTFYPPLERDASWPLHNNNLFHQKVAWFHKWSKLQNKRTDKYFTLCKCRLLTNADVAVTIHNFSPTFHCSPTVALNFIDHIVGNQPDDEMVPISDWYVHVRTQQTYYIRVKGQVNTVTWSSLRQGTHSKPCTTYCFVK